MADRRSGLSADVLGLVDRWVLSNGPGSGAPHEHGTTVHADAPEYVQEITASLVRHSETELNQPPPR